jgi:3-hydroxybutyryl-CoA dehydrogenase
MSQEIKKVGVAGCGIMGSGIVQVCASSGYDVTVMEVEQSALDKGLRLIASRLDRDVKKEKMSSGDRDVLLGRIKGTTNNSDFSGCDIVIEAVTENIDLKKKLFADLDKICPEHTILATNTSVLSVLNIAIATTRLDKVLGLHFFNPVQVMKLVEVIKTITTSEETLQKSVEFVKSLGKRPVIARDTPGFIVNRVLSSYLFSAVCMLESGVATREDIDTAISLGLNHPIGPLRLMDFIGLDTVLSGAEAIYEELKEPQYAAPLLLKKMVDAGWLGRKSGKGFYDYGRPAL